MSVAGMLMADESYLGQAWSATAATGQRRVLLSTDMNIYQRFVNLPCRLKHLST